MNEPLRQWEPVPAPSPVPRPKPRAAEDQSTITRLAMQLQVAEDAVRRIELLAFDARRRIDEMRRTA